MEASRKTQIRQRKLSVVICYTLLEKSHRKSTKGYGHRSGSFPPSEIWGYKYLRFWVTIVVAFSCDLQVYTLLLQTCLY